MFQSQVEAKRLLVGKVISQAQADEVPLLSIERTMLSWSESDSGFVADPGLPKQLAAEISDEDYERKVVELLARSYRADLSSDGDAAGRWQEASKVLHEGDHYILVMLDAAVGNPLKRWWQFWR